MLHMRPAMLAAVLLIMASAQPLRAQGIDRTRGWNEAPPLRSTIVHGSFLPSERTVIHFGYDDYFPAPDLVKKRSRWAVFLGWLAKLSGPGPFYQIGGSVLIPGGRQHFRLEATYGRARQEREIITFSRVPSAASGSWGTAAGVFGEGLIANTMRVRVQMITGRLLVVPVNDVELVRGIGLEVGVGANLHRFFGDGFTGFTHPSWTVQAALNLGGYVVVGGAVNVFQQFDESDFGQESNENNLDSVDAGVSTTGPEVSGRFFVRIPWPF